MLTVPVMLGQFMLVERMGSGGMGAVYRGLDLALNRFVAIKVMKAALGEDAKLIQSFIREAQSAAALNHRNIVQIYSCGQEQGQPYIVMELVTGGKMNQLFSTSKPMDEVALLKVSLDVAEGLKAAHEVGLVHGDIKPENVLIDQNGTGKIVDFGLAQFVNAQKNRGEIWGTPYYISPERARGNNADHRSDLYSLGASMFHALTGQPPFDGETATDVVLARLKHPPPDLKVLRPDLTDQTVALINRMMATDPSLRYPTSASLKSDMIAAMESAREARKSGKGKAKKRSGNTASRLIGLAALLLIMGVGYWLVSEFQDQQALPPASTVAKPPPPPKPVDPSKPADDMVKVTMVTGKDGVARPLMEIKLFTPEEDRGIAAAFALLTGDDIMAAHRALNELGRKMPSQSLRAMWMPVLEAIPLWAVDDRPRATKGLEQMASRFKSALPEEHPVHMPKVLASSLLGTLTPDELGKRLDGWPAWFGDLALFMAGAQAVASGQLDDGVGQLDLFLGRASVRPIWVDSLRPAARQWRDWAAELVALRRQNELRLAAENAAAATAALESFRKRAPLMFGPQLADDLKRAAKVSSGLRGEKAEARARAERAKVQEDLIKVDRALAGVSAMVLRNRDFRKAALSISTLVSDMKTEEGRKAAVWLRDMFDQLDALKAYMIRAVDVSPYTRADGSDLDGDVISANAVGVRVTLDGRSVSTRAWDTIPLRSYFKMAEFFTSSPRLPETERAQALAALALYSLMNGQFDTAITYAERAIALDPAIAANVRRLMPGLISEG
jgi:serine/threonine protein kinase/tetratricopeptide (TPR) repeat protein